MNLGAALVARRRVRLHALSKHVMRGKQHLSEISIYTQRLANE